MSIFRPVDIYNYWYNLYPFAVLLLDLSANLIPPHFRLIFPKTSSKPPNKSFDFASSASSRLAKKHSKMWRKQISGQVYFTVNFSSTYSDINLLWLL